MPANPTPAALAAAAALVPKDAGGLEIRSAAAERVGPLGHALPASAAVVATPRSKYVSNPPVATTINTLIIPSEHGLCMRARVSVCVCVRVWLLEGMPPPTTPTLYPPAAPAAPSLLAHPPRPVPRSCRSRGVWLGRQGVPGHRADQVRRHQPLRRGQAQGEDFRGAEQGRRQRGRLLQQVLAGRSQV